LAGVVVEGPGSVMYHSLEVPGRPSDSVAVPIVVVSPDAVSNSEFTKTLGELLRRPAVFRVPASAVGMVLGEMAEELLLPSKGAVPPKLLEGGCNVRHPELEGALAHMLGKVDRARV